MKPTFKKHLDAIISGKVSRSNVIGLRKAINADTRRAMGYSTGPTSPKVSTVEVARALESLAIVLPRVTGPLHKSGFAVLRNPRFRKRWNERQAAVIADLSFFRLTGFIIQHDKATPVYEAVSRSEGSFRFINVPWQSGGKGPEVI